MWAWAFPCLEPALGEVFAYTNGGHVVSDLDGETGHNFGVVGDVGDRLLILA